MFKFTSAKSQNYHHHTSPYLFPLYIPYIILINKSKRMGSSPSYQGQKENLGLFVRKSRHSEANRHETLRVIKKGQIQGENQDENPEHKSENKEKDYRDKKQHLEEENQKVQDVNHKRSKLKNYERIAKENLPKKTPHMDEEDQQQNQEENRAAIRQALQRKLRHQPQNKAKDHNTPRHHFNEQQQTPVVQQRHRVRHYVKDNTRNQHNIQQDIAHNPNTVKKTQKRSEEIDYHQFDSAHIRHKAVQEVRQMQHPIHPVKQKDAIYQHEKLYPKLLKNYHAEPHEQHRNNFNNRHIEHWRNAEEEQYEQPHNINIYKRHRIPLRGHSHEEQVQEEPEPKSNPFEGVHRHREENSLEKSMEVIGKDHYQMKDIRKSMNVKVKHNVNDGQITKKRKESGSLPEENNQIPQNANFKRIKPSNPVVQGRRDLAQAKNGLKQLESKSIAEINKQNEFNVTEYDVDPQELVTCREGCGRKFQANRIEKHEIICRKVFQQKRKEFNAQDQRIASKQQKKLLKKSANAKSQNHTKKKSNVAKWKAQSIALRAHIKMGMDDNYVPNEEEKEMLSQQHYIDIVNCPYCGRNFNKNSGNTHVPFCKAQYEKQMEKERFQKPPKTTRK